VVGLLGFSVATIGMFLLSRISIDSTNAQVSWYMVVLGLGLGPSLPLLPLIIQNTFGPQDTAVVTGATQFFRTIGGAIGASVLGTIFNNQLTSSLRNLPDVGLPPQLMRYLSDPNYITSKTALDKVIAGATSHVPTAFVGQLVSTINSYLTMAKSSITYAISIVFTVSMGLLAVALVLFYMVEEQELRSHHGEAEVPSNEAPTQPLPAAGVAAPARSESEPYTG